MRTSLPPQLERETFGCSIAFEILHDEIDNDVFVKVTFIAQKALPA